MAGQGIAGQRLFSQRLQGNPAVTAEEIVRHLLAIQAQEYRGGLWAVGVRTSGATAETVERALAGRSIVRTWPMRGTLHLVAAEDVRWMLPLLTPRVVAGSAGRYRQLGLSAAVFQKSRTLFEKRLRGGVALTRSEMYVAMESVGIPSTGQRGIHILGWLAQQGVICFGPRKGKQHTFVLLDEWIPAAKAKPRDEALAELALRYFKSHGPATVQDFAWWTGLTMSDARTGLDLVQSRLTREKAGGKDYWGPGANTDLRGNRSDVLLLPPFDELLVGYTDRAAAVDPAHLRRLSNLLSPTIVRGGRVIGTWTRRESSGRVTIHPKLFAVPGQGEVRALGAAARRYGEFIGTAAELA